MTHLETSPEKSNSNYVFGLILDEARIHIHDLCDTHGGMSVTNNAENVIKEVNGMIPISGLTISYTDTQGQTDELLHNGESFTGFAAGGGRWINSEVGS